MQLAAQRRSPRVRQREHEIAPGRAADLLERIALGEAAHIFYELGDIAVACVDADPLAFGQGRGELARAARDRGAFELGELREQLAHGRGAPGPPGARELALLRAAAARERREREQRDRRARTPRLAKLPAAIHARPHRTFACAALPAQVAREFSAGAAAPIRTEMLRVSSS